MVLERLYWTINELHTRIRPKYNKHVNRLPYVNGKIEVREKWTEIGVGRPGNVIYGQAKGVFMTEDNKETVTATA